MLVVLNFNFIETVIETHDRKRLTTYDFKNMLHSLCTKINKVGDANHRLFMYLNNALKHLKYKLNFK